MIIIFNQLCTHEENNVITIFPNLLISEENGKKFNGLKYSEFNKDTKECFSAVKMFQISSN